jgi:RNA 3'-terminal phosphate cyclase (ATP)
MNDRLRIDGSLGEGGGQIVRSSLALSLVTGRPLVIENLRARRQRPGLMRQHLTAVKAAAEIGGAAVEGAEIGSTRLVFDPGEVQPGEYDFRIGSAGSTTLVAQTVLPALVQGSGPSVLRLEGGTHNPLAPPFDFLQRTYLPLVARMGPVIRCTLHEHGFFPAGGGSFTITLQPSPKLERFELTERGALRERRVRALVANLPRHIAEREVDAIARLSGWEEECFAIEEVAAAGPGNVVLIELEHEHVTEVFSGVGQKGVKAETVASRAWKEVQTYLESGVAVGEHLADQLLLPLGLSAWRCGGGGRFRTGPLSPHAQTHIEILRMFLETSVRVEAEDGACLVTVG